MHENAAPAAHSPFANLNILCRRKICRSSSVVITPRDFSPTLRPPGLVVLLNGVPAVSSWASSRLDVAT